MTEYGSVEWFDWPQYAPYLIAGNPVLWVPRGGLAFLRYSGMLARDGDRVAFQFDGGDFAYRITGPHPTLPGVLVLTREVPA